MSRDDLLSAVLEPRRRAILRLLADRDMPVGELATNFDVSRPAISQHLAVLKKAGLVDVRPQAGRSAYFIVPERLGDARAAITALAGELPGGGTDAAAPRPAQDTADVAVEARAAAAPEQVFAVASTAAGQRLWLGNAAESAREGGPFRVQLGGGDVVAGTYHAVEPPRHLGFGWGQEGGPLGPDASRVDLTFTPAAEGTLIRLEHRGLPEALRVPHHASWAYYLPLLARAAESAR